MKLPKNVQLHNNENQINAVTQINNQIKKESDKKRSVLQKEKEINNVDTEEKVITSFNDLQQARCHWIQLAKLDLQVIIKE